MTGMTGRGEATAARVRVLAVDDHPMLRAGIAALLADEPDLELVATAENGEEAIARYREHRPDVVLMDLRMPVMGGVDAMRAIRAEDPRARFIAFTTYEGDADIRRALEAGAVGYMLKNTPADEVVRALRAAARGQRVIPPAVAVRLAAYTPQPTLTERELEVIALMAKGLSNAEIGHAIGRTADTVKSHVRNILVKLDVSDRTAAVSLALERGIIHLP